MAAQGISAGSRFHGNEERMAKKGFTIKTPEGGIDVDIHDD